ncbi:hypothetical protein ACGFX4_38965 [Kitasatospora sp. NPDC048365]|uniref:hypothetical protein n=1 Tax=Kitasatospora sp. NPDC048365 TaxID=3364050 RepID=UPI00371E7509
MRVALARVGEKFKNGVLAAVRRKTEGQDVAVRNSKAVAMFCDRSIMLSSTRRSSTHGVNSSRRRSTASHVGS